MTVVAATKAELKLIAKGSPGADRSVLAAAALVLAAELDDPGTSATAKANCAKALGDLLEKLAARMPLSAQQGRDRVDELQERRTATRRTSKARKTGSSRKAKTN